MTQTLTPTQVKAFAAPTQETVSLVTEWLSDNGITAKTTGAFDDWLSFTIPVSKASSLLDAQFNTFVHTPTGDRMIRTLSYSIPADLVAHIEVVQPTTAFVKTRFGSGTPVMSIPIPRAANLTGRALPAPSSCASVITPACLEALYGIPTTLATQTSNQLGVSGFIDQFANVGFNLLESGNPSYSLLRLRTCSSSWRRSDPTSPPQRPSLSRFWMVGESVSLPFPLPRR